MTLSEAFNPLLAPRLLLQQQQVVNGEARRAIVTERAREDREAREAREARAVVKKYR
jgi:signal-transduction protein with cAMP-binding, CBS, and nucleotidyltransferase domain